MENGQFVAVPAQPDLIGVQVRGQRLLIATSAAAQSWADPADPDEESEISSRRHEPKLEQVLDGVAVFAEEVVERLRGAEATKITVEFGCDIAVESGAFVAVIGKASASSSLKVSLEWQRPEAP